MAELIGAIMDETLSPVRAAALLAALAAKGETVDEVVGAARAMRERSVRVEHGLPLVLDVVGTGGDNAHTINISTAAAFVVAGCGVPVAKHGNRAASSACGSADVLEALGVDIDRSPEASARVLRDAQHRVPVRAAPSPGDARGRPDSARARRADDLQRARSADEPRRRAAAAGRRRAARSTSRWSPTRCATLGVEAAAVVHGARRARRDLRRGADRRRAVRPRGMRRWTLDPADYGVHATRVEDPAAATRRPMPRALLAILDGERSPRADLVLLNAALALVVAGEAVDVADGLERARTAVGRAARARHSTPRRARNGVGMKRLVTVSD